MSLEPEFLEMASTTVTIAPLSTTGVTVYGAPSSFGAAVTYTARVEPEQRLIQDSAGQEIMSKFRIFVMSSSASIGTSDQITAAGSTELRIVTVDPVNDDEGQHHVELMLGGSRGF